MTNELVRKQFKTDLFESWIVLKNFNDYVLFGTLEDGTMIAQWFSYKPRLDWMKMYRSIT